MSYLRVKHKTLGTEFSTTEHNPEFETLLSKPAVDSYGAPLPAKHPLISRAPTQRPARPRSLRRLKNED